MSGGRLTEWTTVERPLLAQLEALGWTVVRGLDEDAAQPAWNAGLLGRSRYDEVLLEDRLKRALARINPDGQGRPWLDEARLERAVERLRRPGTGDLKAVNERLHDLVVGLEDGVSVEGEGGGRQVPLRFFAFDDVGANDFLAVSQFRVDPVGRPGGVGSIVPDVVLFVNGIPLVVIECKSPAASDPLGAAIDQLRRYADLRGAGTPEGAPRLFRTNLLMVATHGQRARLGSVTARPKDFQPWRDTAPLTQAEVLQELDKPLGGTLSEQETLVAGALRPAHLLDILRNFTVFLDTEDGVRVKVVPRYQQFRAVHNALGRLEHGATRARDGMVDRRGGVVWHTQGSGKSLTMAFLVRKLRTAPRLRGFKVVVVTDRIDLQDQLSKSARLSGDTVRVAKSRARVEALLRSPVAEVVFVTIQKMQDQEGAGETLKIGDDEAGLSEGTAFPTLNDGEEIVVLVDEAHRSHASALHQNLLQALPNAARIGFTGTPIEEAGKKLTREIFGEFLDRYLMRDAEADGAVLKILYEGRRVDAAVEDPAGADAAFDAVFGHLDEATRERVRAGMTKRAVLSASSLVAVKARDMLEHYVDHVLPNGCKAQVVASSREAAADYVEALEAARDDLVADIKANAEALRDANVAAAVEADGRPAFLVRAAERLGAIERLQVAAVISGDRNDPERLKEWSDPAKTKARIEAFKKPLAESPLAFLVVKSKLLTGFDAKVEQAMYVDRPLSGADLLQAIARTNRTGPSKKRHGVVVDYANIGESLAEALRVYAPEDRGDVEAAVRRPEDLVPELRAACAGLDRLFAERGVGGKDDVQAYAERCVEELRDPAPRADFSARFRDALRLYDALMPLPAARPFGWDVKLYAFVAKAAHNAYRDPRLDVRGEAAKVQGLLDEFVRAHGVDPAVPPVGILDPGFAAQVERRRNPRAQAAEMEHAARHHISATYDEADPARAGRLSERLDAILRAHEADWERLVEDLNRFVDRLRDEERASDEAHGLAAGGRPILGVLENGARPGVDRQGLLTATDEIVEHLRQEAASPDFWDNPAAFEACRRWVHRTLDGTGSFDFQGLNGLSASVMAVARANRTAFGR